MVAYFYLRKGIDEVVFGDEQFKESLGVVIAEEQAKRLSNPQQEKQHIFTKLESIVKIARMFIDDKIFNQNYIVMEDLRKGMHYPCILDIKMGSKAYNPIKIAR